MKDKISWPVRLRVSPTDASWYQQTPLHMPGQECPTAGVQYVLNLGYCALNMSACVNLALAELLLDPKRCDSQFCLC